MVKRGSLVLALVVLVSLGATTGFAGSFKLKADIPFDFVVGEKTLPAGTYFVSRLEGTPGVLLVRSEDARSAVTVLSRPGIRSKALENQTRLDFNRYANRYFLSRIWSGGEDSRELPKSKLEREAGVVARNTVRASHTSIAALRVQ
jgi:hypothetical protein